MKHSEQGTVGLGRRSMRRWFSILTLTLLAGVASAADYTWVGNSSSNWNLAANWSPSTGYPGSNTSDNAWITNVTGSAYAPSLNQNLTINNLYLTSTTGAVVNQSGTYQTLTINGGLVIATPFAATNLLYPVIYGSTFGIGMTSSVLVLESAYNSFVGGIAITGGVLDVSASIFSTNSLSAAGGSNTTPVVLGDLNAGLNAEVRVKGGTGALRGIVVDGGAGTRTIRFVGASSAFYTNAFVLSNTVVMAPGYPTDSPGANTYTINNLVTGTGGVTVANGAGIILLNNSNNNYTGQTKILAGTLQYPVSGNNTNYLGSPSAFGTNAVLLGDTSGTNNATFQFSSTSALTNFYPIHVQAGSSGSSTLLLGTGSGYLQGQLTLDQTLNLVVPSSAHSCYLTNVISGPGGLNIQNGFAGSISSYIPLYYSLTNQPAFTGGTVLNGTTNLESGLLTGYAPMQLFWQYSGNTGDTMLVRFGSNASGGPAAITLNGGQFAIWPTASGAAQTYTNDNPIVVLTNNNIFSYPGNCSSWASAVEATGESLFSGSALLAGFKGTNGTMVYTGPISLGSILELGDVGMYNQPFMAKYLGNVTLNQSVASRRELFVWRYNFAGCTLGGNILDGSGTAANSLLLRYSTYKSGAPIVNITGTGSTFANGTVVEGDLGISIFNVTSASGSLGLGNLWLLEGGWLRLNSSTHLAGGATATLYGNEASMSVLGVGANFLPTLTSNSSGVLAIDTMGGYTAVSSQASVGNGMMYLGSISNGVFTGNSLVPCSDNIYRLGGGGGTLTITNGALIGTGRSLQVGAPCGISVSSSYGIGSGGAGTILLSAANTYSGTTVHVNSTLQGVAQASGSPFGNTNASVTLNGGTLQLNGINSSVTNAIGALTVNGAGIVTVNQSTTVPTPTNALLIASLPTQSATAPWVAIFNGHKQYTLGGYERIVISNTNNLPVVNGMVPPWLIDGNTVGAQAPDFLTYSNMTDAAGVIGFTNAVSAYTNIANAAALDSAPSTSIANVTNATVTMDQNCNVYALRFGSSANQYVTNNQGNASGYTLTVGSGGIICPNKTLTVSDGISFSNAAGIIYNLSSQVATFLGPILATNGLTLAGMGINAGSANTYLYGNNAITGTVAILGGGLYVTNENALGSLANPILLNGGSLSFAANNINDTRAITVGPAGGILWVNNNSTNLTFGGPITGPGCLFLFCSGGGYSAGSMAITNVNNTYGGGTLLSVGVNPNTSVPSDFVVTVASNATFGIGDVTVSSAITWLYGNNSIGGGDINGANVTGSRQARLSVEPYGTVCFMSAAPSVGSLSGSGYLYLTNTTLTVGGDNSSTLFDGMILPFPTGTTGQIVKAGSGTFTFKGVSMLTGTNVVSNGTFVVDGYMANAGITVLSGATLAGAGSVGPVTLNSGAIFQPGSTMTNVSATTNRTTTLTASSLTFNPGSIVTITINGPTNYTQIVANGPVTLTGSTLQINLNYNPGPSDTFTIITGATGITGTFNGLPQGHLVQLGNGYQAQISYPPSSAAGTVTLSNVVKGTAGTTMLFW